MHDASKISKDQELITHWRLSSKASIKHATTAKRRQTSLKHAGGAGALVMLMRGRLSVLGRIALLRITLLRVALLRVTLWRVALWRVLILCRIPLWGRNTDRMLLLIVVTHCFLSRSSFLSLKVLWNRGLIWKYLGGVFNWSIIEGRVYGDREVL